MSSHSDIESHRLRKRVWQTTFGDLLTLILCLFLVLIASRPTIDPNSKEIKSGTWEGIEQSTGVYPAGAAAGTTVAKQEDVNAPVAVYLRGDDFAAGSMKLSQQAAENLKKQVRFGGYLASRALIRVCGSEDNRKLWWHISERAMIIRRQLIDEGIGADQVGLQLLGKACDQWAPEVTAVVELKLIS